MNETSQSPAPPENGSLPGILDAVMHCSQDPLIVVCGNCTRLSGAAQKLLGTAEESLSVPALEELLGESRGFRDMLVEAAEKPCRFRSKHGSELELEQAWEAVGLRVYRLHERDRNPRDGFKHLPIAAWQAREGLGIVCASQGLMDLTGRPEGALLGEGLLEAVHPCDRDALQTAINQSLKSGQELYVRCRVLTYKQEFRRATMTGVPNIRSNDQRRILTGVVVSSRDEQEGEAIAPAVAGIKGDAPAVGDITSRVLREILEGMNNLVSAIDTEFRYIAFNKAYAETFKAMYGVEARVGWPLDDLMKEAPTQQVESLAEWARALAGESFTSRRKATIDGKKRIFELHYYPLTDEEGNRLGAAQTVWEITQELQNREVADRFRQNLEELVYERTEELNALLGNAPVGFCLIDREFRYVRANPAIASMQGVAATELIGKALGWNFPAWGKTLHPYFSNAFNTGKPIENAEVSLTCLDGRTRHFLTALYPVKGAGGTVKQVGLLALDITDRKQAETELAKAEKRYRQLLQAGRDVVLIYPIDSRGHPGPFTEVNDEACRRYGYTRQELLSKTVFDIVDRPREELERLLVSLSKGQHSVIEAVHVCADGRRMPVEVSSRIHFIEGQEYVVSTCRDMSDRLAAQKKLVESQRLFMRLAEASPDLLYVYDAKTLANVYCNRELEKIVGYTPRAMRELGEHAVARVVHPEDEARVYAHMRSMRQIRQGEIKEIEYRVVAADGSCRWLRCRETLFLAGDDGEAKQIIGIAQDVTERLRHQRLLDENRERLDLALSTGRMGLWDWDLSTNEFIWSESYFGLLGYKPGDVQPSKEAWLERVHPDDRKALEEKIEQALSEGSELQFEWRAVWPNKTMHWLEARGKLHRDADGKPRRMTGIISDIDERKRHEWELRQSEARFRSTFETAAVGMAIVNASGRWLRANDALCNIVGYTHDELTQKTFQGLTHPEDLEADLAQLSRLTAGDIDNYRLEKRYLHKDGHEVWVRLTVSMMGTLGDEENYIAIIQDITSRKHAERALRDSESRHRALFDDSPLSMMMVDAETLQLAQFNDEAHRSLGYDREEFSRLSLGDIMTMPEGRLRKLVHETVETGQSRQYETQFKRKDGTFLDVLTTARPLRIEGRTYQLTTSQDITARKRAEKEANRLIHQVTQVNALLDNLIENAPLGIAFYDTQTRFVRVNEALAAMNGIPAEDHIGRTATELLPGRRMDVIGVLERVMQARRPLRRIAEGETPALPGEKRQWEIVYYPVEVDGELLGVGAISEDVTDRRRAQDAILRANQKIRAIVESIGDGFISVDRNFRVTYINASATEMLNVGVAEAHLRVLWEVFPSSGVDVLRKRLKRTIATRADQHFEIYFDELKRWFDVRCYSRSDGLSVFFADITERKRAETALREAKEEAEAANRSKSAFLASMSHDIRTPLTSILGFAELLAERVEAEEREHAETIRQSGERLMETLESVLALARLEGKQLQLKPTLIDAGEELRSAQRILKQQAEKRGLELDLEVPDEPVQIRVDRSALNRALMNLVGNSLKFTKQGGICLRLIRGEGKAIIEVSDTGCGIPEEFLPKVFLAFERGTDGGSEGPEGSGLGLAITKQIVEYMDGTISVQSEVGKGTTFTMEFPITKEPETTSHKPVSPRLEDSQDKARRKMLVVEDYQNIRTILRVMLEEHYEIKMAATVAEALEIARDFQADIALLDINIEEKNSGIGLLQKLREMPHYADRPIVAFTAYAMPEDQERFTSLGFDSVLVKPFTRQSLESALTQAFSGRE